MNTHGISQLSYTKLKAFFESKPEVQEVLIFGSRAMGKERNGSDIDLVLVGNDISDKNIIDWSGYINETLPIPYQVDLLGYHLIQNQDLKSHIDRIGKKF